MSFVFPLSNIFRLLSNTSSIKALENVITVLESVTSLKRQANNDTIINRDNVFCCSGLSINIIIYLNNAIPNYLFELYFQEEKLYGAYNNDSGTWNGIVADILNGKGDLGIDLTLSAQRCIHLGCSLGYLLEGI